MNEEIINEFLKEGRILNEIISQHKHNVGQDTENFINYCPMKRSKAKEVEIKINLMNEK